MDKLLINSLFGMFPVMTYKNATPFIMLCTFCYHILFSMYNSVLLRNKVMLSWVYSSRHISKHIEFGVLLTADILATLKTLFILNGSYVLLLCCFVLFLVFCTGHFVIVSFNLTLHRICTFCTIFSLNQNLNTHPLLNELGSYFQTQEYDLPPTLSSFTKWKWIFSFYI